MEDPRLDGMRAAIARLPETHREVLEMRLADELSYAQIAEAMDLPIGTVRSRIHHAVLRLRTWASENHAVASSGLESPSRGPTDIPAERQKR
jgi:RNA polymerase sigma-70 factor (ECF subfamily)